MLHVDGFSGPEKGAVKDRVGYVIVTALRWVIGGEIEPPGIDAFIPGRMSESQIVTLFGKDKEARFNALICPGGIKVIPVFIVIVLGFFSLIFYRATGEGIIRR